MKRTSALMKRGLFQRAAWVMANAKFIVSRLLRENKPWWWVGWNSCAARKHVIGEMRGHWPPCHVYQNISLNTSVYEWCSLIKTCSLDPANQNLICFIGVFFSVSFQGISENELNFAWKCEDNENHELISVAIGFHHCDSHQKTVSKHGEMIGPTKTFSLNICDKRNKLSNQMFWW